MLVTADKLYQWDLNRKVKITPGDEFTIDEVHFHHPYDNAALVVECKNGEVAIPNILLQYGLDIHMYITYDDKTQSDHTFEVTPRQRPSDYVYTETEVLSYRQLEERIEKLEQNGGGSGGNTTELQKLIFKGAVNEEYDGTEEKTINIPIGGS